MQKLREQQSIAIEDPIAEPDSLLQEWLGRGPKRGEGNSSDQERGQKYLQLQDSENIDSTEWKDSRKKDGYGETRRAREHRIEIEEGEKTTFEYHSEETYPYCRSNVKQHEAAKAKDKRVTIHLKSGAKDSSKLIILPASLEELLKISGKALLLLYVSRTTEQKKEF